MTPFMKAPKIFGSSILPNKLKTQETILCHNILQLAIIFFRLTFCMLLHWRRGSAFAS